MADAYTAAAGIDAPPANLMPADDWLPAGSGARLNLDAEGSTSVVWSIGYGLDLGLLDVPLLDEWGYARHTRGVTKVRERSSLRPEHLRRAHIVGGDAEFVAGYTTGR